MKLRTIVAGFVLCSVAPTPTFAGDTDPAVSVIVGSESNPTLNQPIVVYSGSNTSVVWKDDQRYYHEERPHGGHRLPCFRGGLRGKPTPAADPGNDLCQERTLQPKLALIPLNTPLTQFSTKS